MNNKPTLVVTAAVIIHEGLVLISRRPEGSRHAGFWEFPGGKLEPGETLEQCIKREIIEELGLVIEVNNMLMRVSHTYSDYKLDLHAFICRIAKNSVINLDSYECRWCPPDSLKDHRYRLLPPDRVIAAEVASKFQITDKF